MHRDISLICTTCYTLIMFQLFELTTTV